MAGIQDFYQDTGSVTKANIKATPGRVWAVRITNANAALRYVQIHNKATIPLATEVPLMYFPIPAGTAGAPGSIQIDQNLVGPEGIKCLAGIGWAVSTTAGTFTDAATAAEHLVAVFYS